MTQHLTDWDQDLATDPEEDYQALVRALQWTQGFGLFFIRCSPAGGDRLIERVMRDVSGKKIEHLVLTEKIDTLYDRLDQRPDIDDIDVLFTSGLEKSIVDYIKPGYGGAGDYYKLDTVPSILGHLNLQRERFRDRFNCCLVCLLPLFAIKYFIHRAPDFFDWRSGIWEFALDRDLILQESACAQMYGKSEAFRAISAQERTERILSIKELLKEEHLTAKEKVNLLYQLGIHFSCDHNFVAAIASYDQAIEIKPDYHQAWYNRACAYGLQENLELALENLPQALALSSEKYLELAKTDSDFDLIRAEPQFKVLIQGKPQCGDLPLVPL